jgi:hypothetical protein
MDAHIGSLKGTQFHIQGVEGTRLEWPIEFDPS